MRGSPPSCSKTSKVYKRYGDIIIGVIALIKTENESSWSRGNLAWFSMFGIFVRGNQYMVYMHFWNLTSFGEELLGSWSIELLLFGLER